MTTYRLPDGAEIASLDVNGSTDAARAWITHPTLGEILILRDKLTVVKPPLPPEPPDGTVYSNEADAVIRCDNESDPEGRWETTGSGIFRRWSEVAPTVTGPGWRRYVPDPADDAPVLPLRLQQISTGEWLATVQPSAAAAGQVFMEVESTDYDPATARAIAAAILRAAREVERS